MLQDFFNKYFFNKYICTGNIYTIYDRYKLTNRKNTNYTFNIVSIQGMSLQMAYFIFNKSCLYTEILSLTVFFNK